MNVSGIQNIDWTPLFPDAVPRKITLVDLIPKPESTPIGNLLSNIQRIKNSYLQFKFGNIGLFQNGSPVSSEIDYGRYLQFHNSRIKALAMSIVKPSDSDDNKALKLLRWVEKNIKYVSDIKNYGQDEYWALPVITLARMSGDCEDGAFLLGSLMLNAGVNPNRVRVYGGFVSAGTNASTGGHAWVAYKRKVDNQWVALDWCYYPTEESIDDRLTLKNDRKYLDDYFYITAFGTVDATYTNTIRDPYQKSAAVQAYAIKPLVGSAVDIRV